jgi:hypothetical protein
MNPSQSKIPGGPVHLDACERAWAEYRTALVEYLLNRRCCGLQRTIQHGEPRRHRPWTQELLLTPKRTGDPSVS